MFRLKLLYRIFLVIVNLTISGHLFSGVNDTLYFSGDANYPPYSFINEYGMPEGFTVDLLKEIAKNQGLNVRIELEDWTTAFQKLKKKKIDGILGMLRSGDRDPFFSFSIPHSMITHILLTRKSSDFTAFDQIYSRQMLVLQDDVMDHFLSGKGDSAGLIRVKGIRNILAMFDSGVGDGLLISRYHANYFHDFYNFGNYREVIIPNNQFPFCFAVQKGNSDMLASLNEGITFLHQNGKYNEIHNKWFGEAYNETIPGFLPHWWKYLAIVLILIAIGFIIWNSSLSKKVDRQTKRIKSELSAKTIAEQQLRNVLERLTIAQRSARIGIWELDLNNMNLFWDDGMFELYERDRQTFKASYDDWIEALHPDDQKSATEKFEECIKNNKDFEAVFRISTPSGKFKYIKAFAALTFDRNKKAIRAVGVNWDVTKSYTDALVTDVLHAISQAAIFSENLVGFMDKIRQELSRVVDTTNFFIGLVEEDSGKLYLPYMRDKIEEFTYFPIRNSISSYVINNRKSQLLYAEDLEQMQKSGIIERAGGQAQVWLGVPLQIENQVVGLIVLQSYTDRNAITPDHVKLLEYIAPQLSLSIKRKKIQDELVKREEVLIKITEQLREAQIIARMGNFEWDHKTRQFAFSDEIYKIFGIEKGVENLNSETFMSLIHSGDSKDMLSLINEATASNTAFETECRIFNKETGEPRIIVLKAQPVMQDGNFTGNFNGILQDITEQKEIEYELTAAKIKAEQSDKLKSAFLANMSHEIRTPMNSILGFSQILTDAEDAEELQRYTSIINKNGEHLLRLIDDIIDISKIEAGLVKVEKQATDLASLADTAIFQFDENEKVKNGDIELRLVKPENDLGLVYTDQTKIKQVLINLIFNALKFTASGYIELRYTLSGDQRVRFEVEDTGIGIPNGKLGDIFDRFMQVNTNEVSKTTGAGLGLSLCKAYIKLLNGEIWVESVFGKGSTFYFEIPFETAPEHAILQEAPLQNAPALKSVPTILIAEDDEDSFLFFETVMQKTGYKYIHVDNGRDAVEVVKNNALVNLVMMDIRMPLMDGLEATRQIKTFRPDIPVIAQTAHAMDGDRQKALDAGCNDYISKPVKSKALLEKINNLLQVKN